MSALHRNVAVYTGTFDPIHLGHLDVIERGSRLFERLIVGVGNNPEKSPIFEMPERVDLIRQVVAEFPNVEVLPFTGLAVAFVREMKAGVILRGMRTTSDMEYEFTMSLMNQTMAPEIETVFLLSKDVYSHVSSSLLRQVASFGGTLDQLLPTPVKLALQQRINANKVKPPVIRDDP